MSKYIRRIAVPAVLGLALILTACGEKTAGDDGLAADSSLSRDLALAGADSLAEPTLTDTFTTPSVPEPVPAPPRVTAPVAPPRATAPKPAAPKPAAPKPSAPPAAAPAPTTTASGNKITEGSGTEAKAMGTIAAGTRMVLTSNQKVCTNTNKVGDRFTATIAESVTGSNGAVIPAGATAVVRITELKRSENANDDIRVGLDVVSVSFGGKSYAVSARTAQADIARVRSSSTENDAKKVIGGAVIGAIAGQILGKDTKGTVIGAASGAAAGTAAAAATANFEGCLNEGARISIVLNDATTVPAGS